jgi:hypothetical protein
MSGIAFPGGMEKHLFGEGYANRDPLAMPYFVLQKFWA